MIWYSILCEYSMFQVENEKQCYHGNTTLICSMACQSRFIVAEAALDTGVYIEDSV